MDIMTIIVSAVVSLVIAIVTAYVTTRLRVKEEYAKWRREFAWKYGEVLAESRSKVEKIADQYPFGYLLIQYPDGIRYKQALPVLEKVTIGRAPNCDVVIKDKNISRLHAVLRIKDEKVYLHDMNTHAGTY
jgi:hypothetical protein